MIAYIDTNPTFTLKLQGGARGTEQAQRSRESHGYVMYTVFVSGWPYSLATVRYQIDEASADDGGRHPKGSWTVFCMSRRDIGLDLVETQSFASREDATAFIRDTYTAALRLYEQRAAEVLEWTRRELSPVVKTNPRSAEIADSEIIVGIIYKDPTRFVSQHYFEMVVNVQEAITIFDRSEIGYFTPTVVGWVVKSTIQPEFTRWRHGFAEWRIPAYSKDYHIGGWRSDTGLARSKRAKAA